LVLSWLSCPNQGLFRTALVLSWAFVSESGAFSDSFGPFLGFRVRIKGLFGQLWSFLGVSCPNQGLIRTTLVHSWAFVSESGAYSDSFGPFLGFRVRIKGLFGQLWSFPGLSCPNKGLIRTALVLSWAFVSESRAYSDSFDPLLGFRVRIRGLFGQLWSFPGLSCPNQGLIRTALVLSWAFVSESRAYSDSFDPLLGFRVRIRGLFGQLWSFPGLSCPNMGLIRTALIHYWGFVSESGAYSDSFGPF
jgi:hypothetical protein